MGETNSTSMMLYLVKYRQVGNAAGGSFDRADSDRARARRAISAWSNHAAGEPASDGTTHTVTRPRLPPLNQSEPIHLRSQAGWMLDRCT